MGGDFIGIITEIFKRLNLSVADIVICGAAIIFAVYFWFRNKELKEENSKQIESNERLNKRNDKLQKDNDELREKIKEKDCQYINLQSQKSKLELKNEQLHNAVSAQVKMRERAQRERNNLMNANNKLMKVNSELIIKITGGFINGEKEAIQNRKNN